MDTNSGPLTGYTEKSLQGLNKIVKQVTGAVKNLFDMYDQAREKYMGPFFESEFTKLEKKRIQEACAQDPNYHFYPRLDIHDWMNKKGSIVGEQGGGGRKILRTGNDSVFWTNNQGKYCKIYRPIEKYQLEAYYDYMEGFAGYFNQNIGSLLHSYHTIFLYSDEMDLDDKTRAMLKIDGNDVTHVVSARPHTIDQCLKSRGNVSDECDVCVVYGDYIGEGFEKISLDEEKLTRFVYYALTQYVQSTHPDTLNKLRYIHTISGKIYNPLIESRHINFDKGVLTILDVSNIIVMIKILKLGETNIE